MSSMIDNMIAIRLMSMLVKPFRETAAYRLGIIDDRGNVLKPMSSLESSEQKDAYNYLHRLVFNVKRLINKLPGGESQIKNLAAGLLMVHENYEAMTVEANVNRLLSLVEQDESYLKEQIQLLEAHIAEEGEGGGAVASAVPANVTGPGVSTDIPLVRLGKSRYPFRRQEVAGKLKKKTESVIQWSGSSKPGVGPAEG